MANEAQQLFMREMASARAWFLLLLPLSLLLVRYSLAKRQRQRQKQKQPPLVDDDGGRLPPSPPALPVVGHLHLVGSLPHLSLRDLARKHGPDLMLLRLGAMPVIVVSSPSAAEAVLRTHDHVFASRPYTLVAEIVLYGPSDLGFSPYGDYWRLARKLVTTHMLSVKKVQSMCLAREEEVRMVMDQIGEAAAAGAAVNLSDLLDTFLNDMGCRTVIGESFRSKGLNKVLRELVVDTAPLLAGFNVEDFFPFLARFGVLSRMVRAKSERLKRRWDHVLDKLIQDHERDSDPKDKDADFIHVLLSVQHEYGLNRDQIKGILLDVFVAGLETTASALDFTMSELMRRPHMMKKLQAEVDSSVSEGQEGFISQANLNLADMTYLRAVVKESLRLHPVAPLLPHFSTARCTDIVGGYTIPAGVRVLINTLAISRDARYWEDAEEFIPERFITGHGSAAHLSFKGNDFQYLPFGSGRRVCPGVNYAIASVELMLANLVHRFDWELPKGCDIDMSEGFGIVARRKDKLLLVPKLRV